MAYMNRGRHNSYRNEYFDSRDNRDNRDQGGFGVQELASKSLFIQSKKFFIDVKQNRRGKFVKISEVSPSRQKMRLVVDMATAKDIHEKLSEFCEFYSSLGPAKWDKSRMGVDEGKLKSEVIFREDRRYYMDLKENHRGRFLKISMTLPNFERSQIVIPAQGMVDIRDALTDLLHEYGQDDSGTKSSSASSTAPTPRPANTASTAITETVDLTNEDGECLTVDGKTFSFQVCENPRGSFMRISEVSPNFRTAINVPSQSWEKFIEIVERATVESRLKHANSN